MLAAHRHGIRTVILPRRCEAQLEEVPEQARLEMEFVLVDHMDEVLRAALEPARAVSDLPEAANTDLDLGEAVA